MTELVTEGINLFDENYEEIVDVKLFFWKIESNDPKSASLKPRLWNRTETDDSDYFDYGDYFHKV